MKLCNSCQQEKPDTDFHKRKASTDGLAAKCKKCQSDYDRSRANDPKRIDARAKYAKTKAGIEATTRAKKKWANKNKNKIYKITKNYRKKYPNKYRAHGKVAYEVKLGNLTKKPCEVCGTKKVHAHHDDYSKPLDIRWLCDKHHNEWHRDNGEGKNP